MFDNGLAQGYWSGSYANSKAKSDGAVDQTREVLDAETGAVVTTKENATLRIADKEVESNASGLRKAKSRGVLFKPIIERLKAQASYGSPAKVIDVSGAVKFPEALYPLAKNTSVSSLLAAAGGLNQNACLSSAELTRRNTEGDKSTIDRINFSLKDAISGKYPVALMAHKII